jgi:hypothetical protein
MGRRRNGRRKDQSAAVGTRRSPSPPPAIAAVGDSGAGAAPDDAAAPPRRLAARTCGWCQGPITVKPTGRLPKWCSPSCRQRAWEQSRAAASGLAAVRVVERRVEIPTPVAPRRQDWPRLLADLARQLEDGRIYDRDLLALGVALNAVYGAYNRRPFVRSLTGR